MVPLFEFRFVHGAKMINLLGLADAIQATRLRPWLGQLERDVASALSPQRHGDLPRWLAAIDALPNVRPSSVDFCADSVRIGVAEDIDTGTRAQIESGLRELHPWRKGPFEVFGIFIDTEWRSDWKWQRLKDHIQPLTGRTVLDVGCGRGRALQLLAQQYPNSTFVGIDLSQEAIDYGRNEAEKAGLSNLHYLQQDVTAFDEEALEHQFDLVRGIGGGARPVVILFPVLIVKIQGGGT